MIRGSWAPLSECRATREWWRWGRWKATVIGTQGYDTRRCLRTNSYSGVILGQEMGSQIVVIGRIEGRHNVWERESVYEYIVNGFGDGRGGRARGPWDVYGVGSESAGNGLDGVVRGSLDHRDVEKTRSARVNGRAGARRSRTRRVDDDL